MYQNKNLCFTDVLTLTQTTNFRLFQTQIVCRQQCYISKWVKKHCGKRRNCSMQAISPIPTVFSKDLFCRTHKNKDLFGKGLNLMSADHLKLEKFVISLSEDLPTYHTINM